MLSLRLWFSSLATHNTLSCSSRRSLFLVPHQILNNNTLISNTSKILSCCYEKPIKQNGIFSVASDLQSSSFSSSFPKDSPFSGLEDALVSYLFGKKRATDIAHMHVLIENWNASVFKISAWFFQFSETTCQALQFLPQ